MLHLSNKKFLIIALFFLFFSSPAQGQGQEISAEVSLDRSTITVGDPVLFRMIVRYNPSLKIVPSRLGQNLGQFVIRDYQTLPLREEEGMMVEETRYLLTLFEVGSFEIPFLQIRYTDPDGKSHSISTSALKLEVKAVNTENIQDIRDIKDPLEITWNWRPLVRGILLLTVLLVAGWGMYLLIRRWRQKRRSQVSELAKPLLSPEEEALAAMRKLRETGWENAKQFYSRISEILRCYVGRRYQFMAMELTSEELEVQLKYKDIGEKPFEMVSDILIESDLVKFAKYSPTPHVMENIFPQMEKIIESTQPNRAGAGL